MDRASYPDSRGPGFEPWLFHLKKISLLYLEPSGSSELDVWSLSCILGDTRFRQKSRFAKSNNVLLAWPDMTFLSLSVHYFNNRMEKVGYHAMK